MIYNYKPDKLLSEDWYVSTVAVGLSSISEAAGMTPSPECVRDSSNDVELVLVVSFLMRCASSRLNGDSESLPLPAPHQNSAVRE